jgi:hypothetical protein
MIRWTWYVARVEEKKNTCRVLWGNLKYKGYLEG